MARREAEPLTKHLVSLYKGDMDRLTSFYENRVPGNKIIRTLVRNTIRKIEEARNIHSKIDAEEITLTEEELLNAEQDDAE